MKPLSYFFFFSYAGLLALAGAWGAILPEWDFSVLFGLDVNAFDSISSATLLSQYRFLRAVECAAGLVALRFWREIYRLPGPNLAFLWLMGVGVAGRILGFLLDGRSTRVMYFFAVFELVGLVVIFIHTRTTREQGAGAGAATHAAHRPS